MSEHPKPPRRFLPQPVETTGKIRRGKRCEEPAKEAPRAKGEQDDHVEKAAVDKPRRRFNPEPIETTFRTKRGAPSSPPLTSTPDGRSATTEPMKVTVRPRFAPQLIETTRRSRRSPDLGSIDLSVERPSHSEKGLSSSPRRAGRARPSLLPVSSDDASLSSSVVVPETREIPARHSSAAGRNHSFRVPSLDPIASSESDESNCPSLSTSPSAFSEDGPDARRHGHRMRESCDERFSGYLLDLAARAAEKQLRQQALAAFPNDDFHEPVDHFAIDREPEDNGLPPDHEKSTLRHDPFLATRRKDSHVSINWEAEEIKSHHDTRSRKRRADKPLFEAAGANNREPINRRVGRLQSHLQDCFGSLGTRERERELEPMRIAASPPMLGQDLKFRQSQSPQTTTSDFEHKHDLQPMDRSEDGGGLWMGFCVAKDRQCSYDDQVRTGLLTPAESSWEVGKGSPAASQSVQGRIVRQSPIDRLNSIEEQLDKEFSDEFVTQVYNYLSLGYPALARKFDDELSKISRVPVEELSQGDHLFIAKGFVGLHEGRDPKVGGRGDQPCGRWRALRIYIRTWAMQHPDMSPYMSDHDTWGVRARRGSWAI